MQRAEVPIRKMMVSTGFLNLIVNVTDAMTMVGVSMPMPCMCPKTLNGRVFLVLEKWMKEAAVLA